MKATKHEKMKKAFATLAECSPQCLLILVEDEGGYRASLKGNSHSIGFAVSHLLGSEPELINIFKAAVLTAEKVAEIKNILK